MSNNTRSKRPYRWPYHAAEKRQQAEDLASEIVRIVEILRSDPHNQYLFQEITGDIRFYAERIRRLMVEAKIGPEQPPNGETNHP